MLVGNFREALRGHLPFPMAWSETEAPRLANVDLEEAAFLEQLGKTATDLRKLSPTRLLIWLKSNRRLCSCSEIGAEVRGHVVLVPSTLLFNLGPVPNSHSRDGLRELLLEYTGSISLRILAECSDWYGFPFRKSARR